MTRPSIQISFKGYLTIVALLVVSTALVGSPQQPPTETNKDKPNKAASPGADEELRREAEKVVGVIDIEVLRDDKWTKVERIEKPLLFYGDHTRDNDRGSVWGWGRKGRPLALLELFQSVNDRTKWAFAICNTSGRKLRATRAGAPWWGANDSVAELKDIPGAPAPSAEARQRQRQLKLLAEKFTGHQFWDPDNSRYELRRLERPLYTYQDEAGGGVGRWVVHPGQWDKSGDHVLRRSPVGPQGHQESRLAVYGRATGARGVAHGVRRQGSLQRAARESGVRAGQAVLARLHQQDSCP